MDLKCIFSLAILVSQISLSSTQNVNVVIQGATSIGETDDNFVCVTLDWWPTEKCNYNQCPWGKAGLLNLVTFGLNALLGRNRSQIEKDLWVANWQLQNARDFMKYTISRGYKVDSYEFGNQLSEAGMDASVEAEQYGKDIVVLKNLLKELHPDPKTQPKVLGPSGYCDEKWFNSFLEFQDMMLLMELHTISIILVLVAQTYKGVLNIVNKFKPQSGAWVSESGGALHGSAKDLSLTFADGFWYLDQLGMASTYNHKVFCRQTLIDGNYALLNTTTSM
ncbi:heparanase-like protein 2 [Gossypium hirsutum]|uniref:Heparanase-like protein 2 n=1 Tax=Gossypium hirsutum TaxID=3635 RepID=A0A1U8I118_GOSHI|nr:heparanase-like protein 2 [Gossypium hirsutum]